MRKFAFSLLVYSNFDQILHIVEKIIYVWLLDVVQLGWTKEVETYLKNQPTHFKDSSKPRTNTLKLVILVSPFASLIGDL